MAVPLIQTAALVSAVPHKVSARIVVSQIGMQAPHTVVAGPVVHAPHVCPALARYSTAAAVREIPLLVRAAALRLFFRVHVGTVAVNALVVSCLEDEG